MPPENDNNQAGPHANQPQSPQPPQANAPQNNLQPGAQFTPSPAHNQNPVANGNEQAQLNTPQVGDWQAQPQTHKGRTLIVVAAITAVLLIIGIVGFFVLGTDSDSNDTTSNTGVDREASSDGNDALNDARRKTDLAKFVAESVTFQANNNGRVPTFEEARTQIIPDYVLHDEDDAEFNDPVTNQQYVVVDESPDIGEIQYAEASACSGDEIIPGSSRQLAARTLLENGSLFCLSS